ncbi:MAG: GH36-type glycosyl hydrolase domain-containing protein [Candidatus Binatia bacterium]
MQTLRMLLATPQLEDWFERVGDVAQKGGAEQKIAEWLLDNAHQVQRAVRQISRDLPPAYYRRLPAVASADGARLPRVYHLARSLASVTSVQFDLPTVTNFVIDYQRTNQLRIAELWAVPTMLRIVCLEIVCDVSSRTLGIAPPCRSELEPLLGDFADAERLGRAIRGLTAVSSISWSQFVDRTSVIEAVLAGDPAGAYSTSDRETRDRYRRAVEDMADVAGRTEQDVAAEAVALAAQFQAAPAGKCGCAGEHIDQADCAPAPCGHVGHWLIGRGRDAFERRVGARPALTVRARRAIGRHALEAYLGAIATVTAAALGLPAALLAAGDAAWPMLLLGLAAATPAAVALAVALVQWVVSRATAPRVLPKLDFHEGIPARWRTAVVMPAMLTSDEEIDRLLDMLERHFLSNPDPQLLFALLTDFADASAQHLPGDENLFERAARGIRELNARFPIEHGDRFHLAHRGRVYSEAESCWMGWERKRGKIEEWNRHLRSPGNATFRREGNDAALASVRFVITLDSDTVLPTGAAARLVGILSHPLNRPRFEPASRLLTAGYTIIQPRVEIAPEASERSDFARICAGDSTIDTYSRAVSDVYQDLFATGIYVGKGIYDVDAFMRSLDDLVPENALASHDLFEGIHGRAALATDVVVYEDFPPHYLAFVRRLHRWTRGDWQLLPWLLPKVATRAGDRVPNSLGVLQRWFILDNLRRSTFSPALLAMIVLGWLVLPVQPVAWTFFAVAALVPHGLLDLALEVTRRRPPRAKHEDVPTWQWQAGDQFRRAALMLMLLPFESWVILDAVVRALVRMTVTHKHLLQWQTASQIAARFETGVTRAETWKEMAAAPATVAVLAAAISMLRPEALAAAAPLLLLWVVSPEIAHRVSAPRSRRARDVGEDERIFLRRLARRTWLFFETFVGPDGHWLPPDNYQETPSGVVDRRTSPTNIGMLLLSTASAWNLGYIGLRELALRLADTLDNLAQLERHRGHLLNWYDTRTRKTLLPAYVSTVDSGNLAAALIAVSGLCPEAMRAPVLSTARWDGLMDALGWLEEALGRLVREPSAGAGSLATCAAAIRRRVLLARNDPAAWSSTLRDLCDHLSAQLDGLLLETIESHKELLHLSALREIRIWLDRVHRHLRAMDGDVDELLPWLAVLDRWEPGKGSSKPGDDENLAAGARAKGPQPADEALLARIRELLTPTIALDAIPECCRRARTLLADMPADRASNKDEHEAWRADLDAALSRSIRVAMSLMEDYRRLKDTSESEAFAPDFGFLYDREQNLFHIGYNVNTGVLDTHHYDLLASECRLASYIAIAKGDVPAKHWLHLGRPLTRIGGRITLLSWGGTMFEYLMPRLLLKGGEDDLLSRSEFAAVDGQRAFAERHGIPWGVSESGFAAVDARHAYQYRAFGVPGLGIKRDLGADLVVAPYATALAVPIQPVEATANLQRLTKLGAMGEHGMHEAVDFTPSRVLEGRSCEVVRSYMSHHQGMALAALNNYLGDFPLVRQFHAHPLMRTTELLLRERAPTGGPLEFPAAIEEKPRRKDLPARRTTYPWRPVQSGAFPELHAIGNTRMTTVYTESGGGGMWWMGRALTNWSPDSTLDDSGVWIYVQDLDDGTIWSVGRQPSSNAAEDFEVVFHPHMIECHHRHHGIGIRLEVYVAPGDDIEIRSLSVVNGSDRARRLAIVSYAEIVLAPPEQFRQHPAFSRLFVRAEPVPEMDGLLFVRRPRGDGEIPLVLLHRLLPGGPNVRMSGSEVSRERFLGRLGDMRRPAYFHREKPASTTPVTDLDPIASLEATMELAAGATETVAFATLAGSSRASVVAVAQRCNSSAALDWTLTDAATESAREAARYDVDPGMLQWYQRLLSLVLQPHTPLRCAPELIAANTLSQSDLWRMGISGDLPILLLMLAHASESGILDELVRAHALWTRRGIAVDLVVVHSQPAGYEDVVAHALEATLERFGVLASLRRRGGIHLVRSDQARPEDLVLLKVTARVQLDGARSLQEQLHDVHAETRHAPPFVPTDVLEAAPEEAALERDRHLLFDNGIGGFASGGRQYVIHPPEGTCTLVPWSNGLANGQLGTLVTESGGGYTWSGNASERRLSTWRNDPVGDRPSEVLYLRDEETGAVWSPMLSEEGAAVEVRHTSCNTTWRRRDHGLEQEIVVFVAHDEPVKVIQLRLRDLAGRPRRITATYYVELVLGMTRATGSALLVVQYEPGAHALLARNPWNALFAERVAFLACELEPHGFTTNRSEFLGREGSLRIPAALMRWGLSNSTRPGPDPCAALQVHVEIGPGEEMGTHFAFGDGRDRVEAVRLAGRWRSREVVESVRAASQASREKIFTALEVRTPEPALDVMVNHWLLHQCLSSRILGRTGYYQSSGAFGFRDQLQDVMALLLASPALARDQIVECARRQFSEGDVLHWWHPPDGRGVRTRCSDDLLWLPFVTAHYVEATGDIGILDEAVPFLVAPPLGPDEHDRYALFEHDTTCAPLFEHCVRALEHGMTRGEHGLPLMRGGDWNDGMNHVGRNGRGESVWLAWFGIATAHGFARLCSMRGIDDLASAWHRRADELAAATEACAWDGAWYRRAYDDDGRPWGSSESEECRIDSIAQSWSVLCGAGDPARSAIALESAWRELVREEDGVARLLWPPFDKTPRDPGYIKAYPPGVRENGGQYSHAAAWLSLAFANAGNADRALALLRLLNPIEHARDAAAAARYRVEPYVVAADIFSTDPYVGRGGWTWYTGSAAWTYRAAVEGILGLSLRQGMLRIDPCLPPSWPRFEATLRTKNGGALELLVENPEGTGRGVVELRMDGRVVPGNTVEFPADRTTRRVQVRLGRTDVQIRA